MKRVCTISATLLLLISVLCPATAHKPVAGFYLPDSMLSMTLKYKMARDLIVLPVTINDSVKVNLILDTGCRNLILFGKKFNKMFPINSSRRVEFSGLGNGKPLLGSLSLGNKVSINHVIGNQIPVVIVGSNELFRSYKNIHGVVGYEIFLKFEIELNPLLKTVTFRPANKATPPCGSTQVPLAIVDARPVMQSEVYLDKGAPLSLELMIDTGSSLGLLIKTTRIDEFEHLRERVLGIGLNGPVSGFQTVSEKLKVDGLEIAKIPTGIVSSTWHNNGSIGMDVLKDYIVIMNYAKSYVCFNKLNAA